MRFRPPRSPPESPIGSARSWRSAGTRRGSFLATLWAVTTGPRRFVREWSAGQRKAMNPLGFFATSVAVATPLRQLAWKLWGPASGSNSVLEDVLEQLAPYVKFLLIALLCHASFHRSGARRRISSTIALTLYIAGGPAMLVGMLAMPGDVEQARLLFAGGLSTPVPAWAR